MFKIDKTCVKASVFGLGITGYLSAPVFQYLLPLPQTTTYAHKE